MNEKRRTAEFLKMRPAAQRELVVLAFRLINLWLFS
jgi:hypothetical protein